MARIEKHHPSFGPQVPQEPISKGKGTDKDFEMPTPIKIPLKEIIESMHHRPPPSIDQIRKQLSELVKQYSHGSKTPKINLAICRHLEGIIKQIDKSHGNMNPERLRHELERLAK